MGGEGRGGRHMHMRTHTHTHTHAHKYTHRAEPLELVEWQQSHMIGQESFQKTGRGFFDPITGDVHRGGNDCGPVD